LAIYNNIYYETTAAFSTAWEKPGFQPLTKAVDGEWGATTRRGEELPYEPLPVPINVEIAKRYAVDKNKNYVSWMDFDFYIAFDRDNGLGFHNLRYSLVPGWDCPASASCLDTVVHDGASTTNHPGSICMFEQDAGFPLARHTATDYVAISKNTQFIVRWIATVGNYDYFMDYVFSLDGTIEVKIRASGYIQGT
jgi:primary-amine oxidase